jgi:hypothetical protein
MGIETFQGSCHCGAIKFEADLDLSEGSNRCNCSICAKARAWFAFAKGPERFRLIDGTGATEYRWTPAHMDSPHLTYTFCKHCGIRAYAQGNLEFLGGVFHAVSVPALELTPEQLAKLPVRYVNGRDNKFEHAPAHPEWV